MTKMEQLTYKLKNDKVYLAKFIVGTITLLGVSKIINDIIKNNTNPDSALDRAKIRAGSLVLGFMIADAAARYAERGIEVGVELWRETMKELKEAKETPEASTEE